MWPVGHQLQESGAGAKVSGHDAYLIPIEFKRMKFTVNFPTEMMGLKCICFISIASVASMDFLNSKYLHAQFRKGHLSKSCLLLWLQIYSQSSNTSRNFFYDTGGLLRHQLELVPRAEKITSLCSLLNAFQSQIWSCHRDGWHVGNLPSEYTVWASKELITNSIRGSFQHDSSFCWNWCQPKNKAVWWSSFQQLKWRGSPVLKCAKNEFGSHDVISRWRWKSGIGKIPIPMQTHPPQNKICLVPE